MKKTEGGGRFPHLILLAISTGIFMLAFMIKVTKSDKTEEIVAAMREIQAMETLDPDESKLGKLKLVNLPSIIEVFSPSDSPISPIKFHGALEEESTHIAKLYAEAGTEVVSMLSGMVKSISVDEDLGGYVCISSSDDIDIYYYGLTEIVVEKGQPVIQNSELGKLRNDFLLIRVLERGRPVDPLKFLGIEAEVG